MQFAILRFTPALLAIALLILFGAAASLPPIDRFEKDIKAFEDSDKQQPPPQNAVLFLGSSSIRLWDVQKSFPNLTLINRGFGGSFIRESTYYADRIVLPYKPRTIVFYAGDNDIASGITADETFSDYKAFVAKVRTALPDTKIIFLAIKPSVARWKLYDEQKKANKLIEDFSKSEKNLLYVDTATPILGTDGKPRADLLRADGLHLNEEGYKLWTAILTPILVDTAK